MPGVSSREITLKPSVSSTSSLFQATWAWSSKPSTLNPHWHLEHNFLHDNSILSHKAIYAVSLRGACTRRLNTVVYLLIMEEHEKKLQHAMRNWRTFQTSSIQEPLYYTFTIDVLKYVWALVLDVISVHLPCGTFHKEHFIFKPVPRPVLLSCRWGLSNWMVKSIHSSGSL